VRGNLPHSLTIYLYYLLILSTYTLQAKPCCQSPSAQGLVAAGHQPASWDFFRSTRNSTDDIGLTMDARHQTAFSRREALLLHRAGKLQLLAYFERLTDYGGECDETGFFLVCSCMRTNRAKTTLDQKAVASAVAKLSTDHDPQSEDNAAATSAMMTWVNLGPSGRSLERTCTACFDPGPTRRHTCGKKSAALEEGVQSPKPPAKDGLSLEWLSAEQRGGGRPGRWYYWNAKTRESSWADPIQPVDSDDGAAAAGQPARAAGSPGMAGL
jgi:hypothetical protein